MLSSVKTVTDQSTARLLMSNSPRRRLLLSLVPSAATVGQLAARLSLPIGTAHYQIVDLVRRGLLEVEREQRRAGRPVRYYRAVAGSFLVPLEFVAASPGGGLAEELRQRLNNKLASSKQEGIIFDIDASNNPRVSWFGAAHSADGVAEFWHMPKLSKEDAQALIGELRALLTRFDNNSTAGREYLVHAAVVPRS